MWGKKLKTILNYGSTDAQRWCLVQNWIYFYPFWAYLSLSSALSSAKLICNGFRGKRQETATQTNFSLILEAIFKPSMKPTDKDSMGSNFKIVAWF